MYSAGEITRHECINRLDDAVAALLPRRTTKDSAEFQSEMQVTEEALRETDTKRRKLSRLDLRTLAGTERERARAR